MKIVTRDLTPELWPELERLFGPNGACAGCWCMWWRVPDGETFKGLHGAEAKRRQKRLVLAGRSRGVLAFDGNSGPPIGWCAWAKRSELPALARSRKLACDDVDDVWSIPCFFVKAGFRGKGVSKALLRHALRTLQREGARIAEAYPVRPPATNATAFTGTVPFLESEGFETLTAFPRGRQRARRKP